ncbi:hypothetical protein GWK47_054110 [Chionoecetes opilio]|uniref:Uncharacterized protein n=1 Tax=Chionoecetes opilio TaxID=41210 RepID=A0A8J4Y4S1_CHIOP|nr:hypothetical protein GWK47_054110 [Chionoecetes opilio]
MDRIQQEEKETMVRNLFRRKKEKAPSGRREEALPDIDLKDPVTSGLGGPGSLFSRTEEEMGNPWGRVRDMGDCGHLPGDEEENPG